MLSFQNWKLNIIKNYLVKPLSFKFFKIQIFYGQIGQTAFFNRTLKLNIVIHNLKISTENIKNDLGPDFFENLINKLQ